MVLFDYKTVQEVFLTAIHKANFLNSFLESKRHKIDSGKIEELNGKLLEIKNKIENVCDAIEKTKSSDLIKRLNHLQSEQISFESEIETQKKLISDLEYNLSAENLFLETVLKDIDDNKFRIRVRNFLRAIVQRAWIWRDNDLDGVIIHVRFKESNDKLTLITKDKGDWQTLIQLNDEVLGFSNSKGAGWYDGKCNPQGIDPFYLKSKKLKGEEMCIENFILQPPESKD
jgi:hypothetical protein